MWSLFSKTLEKSWLILAGLALRNLTRRPVRTCLTLSGLILAMAVLSCLSAFGQGYRRALSAEINHMGLQLMLVPLGCPYEAAAQVLKGKSLDNSLPQSALALTRRDPTVAVAAPFLMAAVPRKGEGRTDLWVGLDESALALKPWWHMKTGRSWFVGTNSVILGAEAATIEMRSPGDKFFSPETGCTFKVAGILERSGTSDDSLFFVPLCQAQAMLGQSERLTAIAIRLRDPARLREAVERLQQIPGAQVVTLTEMMGTFLNLIGAVRTLMTAIAMVAIVAGAFTVFNTLLAGVVERTGEFSLMRALGASRCQIFTVITHESILLTIGGAIGGLLLAAVIGGFFENLMKQWVPLAPAEPLLALTAGVACQTFGLALCVGLLAGLYPAWQASRLPPALAAKME